MPLRKAILTYKTLNGLTPEFITNMLTPILRFMINNLDHRSTAHLWCQGRVPICMIDHSQSQHQNTGSHFLLIPKTAPSLSSFQTNLKDKLMQYKMLLVAYLLWVNAYGFQ